MIEEKIDRYLNEISQRDTLAKIDKLINTIMPLMTTLHAGAIDDKSKKSIEKSKRNLKEIQTQLPRITPSPSIIPQRW